MLLVRPKPRIVVVEDEAIVAQDLKESVEALGFQVSALAATGEDALRDVEKHRPDVVLMDIVLRGPMDGIEAAQQIRNRFGTPIVYLTAYSDDQIRARARDTAPAAYLIKPVEPRQLLATLDMLIARASLAPFAHLAQPTESRFHGIFEHAPDGIFMVDTRGRIVLANREAERMFGYQRHELVGHPIDMLVPEHMRAAHAQHVQGYAKLPLLRPMGTRPTLSGRRKDGTSIPVQVNLNAVRDASGEALITAVVRDVTHILEVEQALSASEERFKDLFESLPVGVYRSTLDGRFLAVNPALVALTGYSEAELLAIPASLLYADAVDRERMLDSVRRSGEAHMEFTGRRKDGTTAAMVIHARMADDPVQGTSLHGIVIDVTERRRVEKMLQQAAKMEVVGRMASGVAHDFNNVLTVVLGHAEDVLSGTGDNSEIGEAVSQIKTAAERGGALTSKLLAFSRQQPLKITTFDLQLAIMDVEPMLRRLIREDIRLSAESPGVACGIRADRNDVEQIIVNLVVNARDAIAGPGEIAVRALVVEGADLPVECQHLLKRHSGAFCCLAVSDTGHGMSAETQRHIFEPFFTTKARGQGTGLGLSLVHDIVEQAGGAIAVESREGEGTTFSLYLPQVDLPEDAKLLRTVKQPCVTGHTVLLVEDDDAVRGIVARMLTANGHAVTSVRSGQEALLLARKFRFDLLLADVVMPEMDGVALAQALTTLDPGLTVVFMTGYADRQVRQGHVPGAIEIQKPFSAETLAEAMYKAIGK